MRYLVTLAVIAALIWGWFAWKKSASGPAEAAKAEPSIEQQARSWVKSPIDRTKAVTEKVRQNTGDDAVR